jgi:pimeloyl-ACP methyl ester carboxylesterase
MLELAGVTHRDVQARGMRFHVAEAGPADAPTIVLTHGWPQHWWIWRKVIPRRTGVKYRVVTVARASSVESETRSSPAVRPNTARRCICSVLVLL